jgi:hypothetical protein
MLKFIEGQILVSGGFHVLLHIHYLKSQDLEAKAKTSEDHAEGKPSSETLNKAKVKVGDALT